MTAVTVEEEWEIESNDFLKGNHSPEQVGVELINTNRQKDGRWCDGYAILDELKKMGLVPIGQASPPEHFPDEWRGKQIVVLGTRYIRQKEASRLLSIRSYTWDYQNGVWRYYMKRMDSEFGIRVQRNEGLRVPVFKILG